MCPKGGTDFESITSEFPMVLKRVDGVERKKDLQNKKDQISPINSHLKKHNSSECSRKRNIDAMNMTEILWFRLLNANSCQLLLRTSSLSTG